MSLSKPLELLSAHKMATLALSVTGLVLAAAALCQHQGLVVFRRRQWRKVGVVDQLFVFPMKGGRAVETDSFACEELGPRSGHLRDRSFCLLDEK